MTEYINYYDSIAEKKIRQAYFGWWAWSDKMNGRNKKKGKRGKKNVSTTK